MFKLLIADDEGKTTVVPLVRGEITIGRREGNTIRLTDRNVSRRHAKLIRRDNGFYVEDLDSYNGVRLNGVPVLSPRPVNDGDQLTIGDYKLALRSDRPAPAPQPAAAQPPAHARLVLLGPPEPGLEHSLDQAEIIIGRTDENDLVINHRSISRSHAKISVSNNVCRLYDLDSANGVRVNGEDFKEVELRRGDLVELGTVRFRFVGAGEAYQFDADATVQMDAISEDFGVQRSPVVPIVIGVAVVILLAVAGVFAFSWPPGDDEGGASAGTDPSLQPPPAPAKSPNDPSLAEIKAQARELMGQRMYVAALSVLDSVGATGDDEIHRLRAEVTAAQEAHRLWQAACREADQGDLEAVHLSCQRIPEESQFRTEGCCGEAAARFGKARVDAIKQLLDRRDYENARTAATKVMEDRTLPEDLRARAESYARRADKRLASAAPPPSRVGPARPPVAPSRPAVPQTAPQRPPQRPEKRSVQDAVNAARARIVAGDQAGCVRELQGVARTNQVVGMLVSCYQGMGRTSKACALARRYPRCRGCAQFLTRCQ